MGGQVMMMRYVVLEVVEETTRKVCEIVAVDELHGRAVAVMMQLAYAGRRVFVEPVPLGHSLQVMRQVPGYYRVRGEGTPYGVNLG
jgi:hypothetical protein